MEQPKKRSNSFSDLEKADKVKIEIKDDVFVANLMATLKPEPWELHKRLKSQKPIDHVRRRIQSNLDNALKEAMIDVRQGREYARNDQAPVSRESSRN